MQTSKKIYQGERNESDFTEYYNITISVNRYIERLLVAVMNGKGLSNKSQAIRNCIYEEYVRMKNQQAFSSLHPNVAKRTNEQQAFKDKVCGNIETDNLDPFQSESNYMM